MPASEASQVTTSRVAEGVLRLQMCHSVSSVRWVLGSQIQAFMLAQLALCPLCWCERAIVPHGLMCLNSWFPFGSCYRVFKKEPCRGKFLRGSGLILLPICFLCFLCVDGDVLDCNGLWLWKGQGSFNPGYFKNEDGRSWLPHPSQSGALKLAPHHQP